MQKRQVKDRNSLQLTPALPLQGFLSPASQSYIFTEWQLIKKIKIEERWKPYYWCYISILVLPREKVSQEIS